MSIPPLPPQFPPVGAQAGFIAEPAATITIDAPCRKCGYNLRGLNSLGRCPECGTPVGLSIQGDLIRYSDPAWLQTLVRGLSFILWGILVGIVVNVLGSFVLRDAGISQWIGILAGLLGVYGAWLLTEPDPSGLGEAQYAKARKFVRVALITGLASGVINALIVSIAVPREIQTLLMILSGVAGLINVAGEFAKFMYLEKLARRIPDDALARRAHFLRWGYAIALASLVVSGIVLAVATVSLRPAAGGPPPTAILVPIGCFAALAALAFLVFGVMTLFLYIRMRRALLQQAILARQVWGEAVGPAQTAP